MFATSRKNGGRDWTRTSDFRLIETALYQLSYTTIETKVVVVGMRIERTTDGL